MKNPAITPYPLKPERPIMAMPGPTLMIDKTEKNIITCRMPRAIAYASFLSMVVSVTPPSQRPHKISLCLRHPEPACGERRPCNDDAKTGNLLQVCCARTSYGAHR